MNTKKQTRPLTVDGWTCTVIRSSRRTMAIEITRDAHIMVRVPFAVSDEAAARFVQQHSGWLATHMARHRAAPPPPTDAEIAELKRRARAYIPDRVAHFGRVMGLTPTGVRIHAARTRFGSCGTTNALNFSCLLMRYPPAAIDYVVVHELAHLRHRNHGPAFYRLIEQYMPDYRERRQLLKGEGTDADMD